MDKSIKKKWIAALRSNKYKQGRNNLRTTDNCYCGVGVLCDVVDSKLWRKASLFYLFSGRSVILVDRLREQIKLPHETMMKVVSMNDAGKTFAEIADFVESSA